MRVLRTASSAISSQRTDSSFQPDDCAQPDDVALITTVDASTSVVSHSAKTPFEFATPNRIAPVVMEPAAVYPAAAASRQTTPTPFARSAGEHPATAASKLVTPRSAAGPGNPLKSGFSGCCLARSRATRVKFRRLSGFVAFDTAIPQREPKTQRTRI